MTSAYLAQYRKDPDLGWVQVNVFYNGGLVQPLEGMGFGANNHFWATSGATVFEFGGGDVTDFLEPS
jgi:hypothetical protein